MADTYTDTVIACVDLVGRAGATESEIGWDCPHVPGAPDGHNCGQTTWYAAAKYRGARIIADRHRSPSAAALALAERMLSSATCRCQRPVSLSDDRDGCRWRLVGQRWEPGCDAPPITLTEAERGDMAAMHRSANRAERRAEERVARRQGGRRGR
jgi:hypothetical protein